jgi:hypothetical protein
MTSYIPAKLRRQLQSDAGERCGYCRSAATLMGVPLEIEHLYPESLGGQTVRENLWLACYRCNKFKGNRIEANDPLTGQSVPLFHPRRQRWAEHFRWDATGTLILGLTPCGRATVVALQMNNEYITETRRFWSMVGRHPPNEE